MVSIYLHPAYDQDRRNENGLYLYEYNLFLIGRYNYNKGDGYFLIYDSFYYHLQNSK
jgi:hypothetical protein